MNASQQDPGSWLYRRCHWSCAGLIWLGVSVWCFLDLGAWSWTGLFISCGAATVLMLPAWGLLALAGLSRKFLPPGIIAAIGMVIFMVLVAHGLPRSTAVAQFERSVISPAPASLQDLRITRTWAFVAQDVTYFLCTVDGQDFQAILDKWEMVDVPLVLDDPDVPEQVREDWLRSKLQGAIHTPFPENLFPDFQLPNGREIGLYERDTRIGALRNWRTGETIFRCGHISH